MAFSQSKENLRRYYQRLSPMLEKPQNRTSTAAIFSFLAASLFGWYAIRPTVQTILYLRREIADKTVINQKMEEKITSLIEAQANYAAVQNQLPLLSQSLPDTPQLVELAKQIQNLANAQAASVSAIQSANVPLLTSEATTSGRLTKQSPDYNITMILNGPYTAFSSFLDGLLNMRRLVTIETMEIRPQLTKRQTPATSGILQLVLKLKTYYTGN